MLQCKAPWQHCLDFHNNMIDYAHFVPLQPYKSKAPPDGLTIFPRVVSADTINLSYEFMRTLFEGGCY